jgi:hypothetical protein
MKVIKIALLGTQHDYANGIVPLIIGQLGFKIQWSNPKDCDLLIYGAFYKNSKKQYSLRFLFHVFNHVFFFVF